MPNNDLQQIDDMLKMLRSRRRNPQQAVDDRIGRLTPYAAAGDTAAASELRRIQSYQKLPPQPSDKITAIGTLEDPALKTSALRKLAGVPDPTAKETLAERKARWTLQSIVNPDPKAQAAYSDSLRTLQTAEQVPTEYERTLQRLATNPTAADSIKVGLKARAAAVTPSLLGKLLAESKGAAPEDKLQYAAAINKNTGYKSARTQVNDINKKIADAASAITRIGKMSDTMEMVKSITEKIKTDDNPEAKAALADISGSANAEDAKIKAKAYMEEYINGLKSQRASLEREVDKSVVSRLNSTKGLDTAKRRTEDGRIFVYDTTNSTWRRAFTKPKR